MIEIIFKRPIITSIVIFVIIFMLIVWYQKKYKDPKEKNDEKKDNDYSKYVAPALISACISIVAYIFITTKNPMMEENASDYNTDTSSSVGEYLSSIRDVANDQIKINPTIAPPQVGGCATCIVGGFVNQSIPTITNGGIKLPMLSGFNEKILNIN